MLDKTWLRSKIGRNENWSLKLLPKERFFQGDVAVHHQSNSWVNLPKAMPELIGVSCIVIIFVIAITIGLCVCIMKKKKCIE